MLKTNNKTILFFIIISVTITAPAKQFIPPIAIREDHIPISLDATQRTSHYPLITGETFRSFAKFVIDETALPFDTEKVETGDTIFVGMPYLDFFLNTVLPEIKTKFILITSNGSGTINEKYLPYLDNDYLFAWFGRNITLHHPKIHIIPLGFCWFNSTIHQTLEAYLAKRNPKSFFEKKDIHTYLNIHTGTHYTREKVYTIFNKLSFCTTSGYKSFPEYMTDLASSNFVISPRGYNIDCYRTWEALLAGSIPVIEAHGIESVYSDLPVIIVENYTQVTKEFLDNKLNEMKTRPYNLNKLHADYWLNLIRAAQKEAQLN